MSLVAGSRVGPYEIVGALGAGGMGEVYRARDTRLGRDVAVKVLPSMYATDPDRARRFEQEARSAGQLNHPNILSVFDVGSQAGVFYLVTELLEGETLRERLGSAPLPIRKAIEFGAQVADAIAAAHDKGIVHRDIKPENLFVTRDGRVKVLDFGLAKLRETHAASAATAGPTIGAETGAGMVLGTVGYMSPEQVRGTPADQRSDIFALGTVLYEMLAGRRAFHGDSAAETMAAIVREDPPSLEKSGVTAPPALERIVQHCLEKNPDERFQSARDLAFDLRSLSDLSTSSVGEAPPARRFLAVPGVALALAVVLAAVAIGFFAGRRTAATPPLWFDKITFRQGEVANARFSGDGKTIVYSASWAGAPEQVFLGQPGNPEFRPLGLPSARLLSVSSTGELAVMLHPQSQGGFITTGTLARVPPGAAAPRELLDDVEDADWAPDGQSLAVVRSVSGRGRVEFPIGTVIFETGGWVSKVRVAPAGDAVAVIHHPARGNDAGELVLANRNRQTTTLSRGWQSIRGLAWSGDEILFSAAAAGNTRQLYAISRAGAQRLVASGTGSLIVYDATAREGVLVARSSDRLGTVVRATASGEERDVSWLDWTLVRDVSADGTLFAFDESGEGGGPHSSVYIRRTDGSPAVRLGEGLWPMLSPDVKWIACVQGDPARVAIIPTGPGESRHVDTPGITPLSARWFPDGKRLLVAGSEPGHALRYYVVPLAGGAPRAVTPEGATPYVRELSPDGRYVLTRVSDTFNLWPVDGGEKVPVKGLVPSERVAAMPTADRVYTYGGNPFAIAEVDLKTGARRPLFTIQRSAEAGRASTMRMTPDGRTGVYTYAQGSSELFLMRAATR